MFGFYLVFCFLIGANRGADLPGAADLKDGLDALKKDLSFSLTCYTDENKEKMVIALMNGDKTLDCYVAGDKNVIKMIESLAPDSNVVTESSDDLKKRINSCMDGKKNNTFPGADMKDLIKKFGKVNALFITPGTKYCGAGNISDSYDDLGSEVETDKCCRTHDSCNDSITAFSSKHGLENYTPITISNCGCDCELNKCLTEADTKTSRKVGNMYFNVFEFECFKKAYPIVKCLKHENSLHHRCLEYELDDSKDKTYEYFNAKRFTPKSEEGDDEGNSNDVQGYMGNMYKTNEIVKLFQTLLD